MLKENSFIKVKYRWLFISTFLGWIVTLLGGMADSIIAGLFLDADAVSAVGLVNPVSSLVTFISTIISVGCAMVYSRTLGAFDIEKSKRVAGTGLIAAMSIGIILTCLMTFGKDTILTFYGVTGVLYDYASAYFNPFILISFVYPMLWLLYYLALYDGDNGIVLLSDLVMAFSNILFSLILVPKYGIAGLGYGTLISTVLGLLVVLIHFFKKTNSVHFKFKFMGRELKNMIVMASSSSLTSLYLSIVDVNFNKIVILKFGEEYLTAYAVVRIVFNLAAILVCGINAGVVFISVAYGENNTYELKRIMGITNRYTLSLGLIMTVLLEFIAPYWSSLYAITDSGVMAVSLFAGKVIPITYILTGFVYTYMIYYSAVNKAVEGNILSISYMLLGPLLIATPLAYFKSFNMMSIGFMLSPLFAILVTVIFMYFRKEIKLFPFLVEPTDEKEAHFDLELKTESIIEVRDRIREFLESYDVNPRKIGMIELVIEDALIFIMGKNDKKVLCECVVMVNDEHVRLITKDNGVIFDITKVETDEDDIRAIMIKSVMRTTSENSNTTTISFNRNTYMWDR